MKKISKFLKGYGFYLAIGVICIGALFAIFFMPNREGNVKDNANPYAQDQRADGESLQEKKGENDIVIIDEDDLDTTDDTKITEETPSENAEISENTTAEKLQPEAEKENEKETVETETFESTTASISDEPFFAEGDTFVWPVEGDVVVPYTDESTRHWYSESLNQTMRTFGICISGEEATEVKAVAKGTVVDIIEDSSSYLDAGMPYVGKLVVVDLGNGYKAIYGFQGGSVNDELMGQVVNTGDVLGTLGSPKGAFISAGDNIYLQVTHNDQVINPLNLLVKEESVVKADGVDMGFAK